MSDAADQSLNYEEFTRLFLRSEREILRFILVLLPRLSDAQDVLQETAVALWKKFDQYDRQQPFLTWAYGFAANEVRRFIRDRARRKMHLDENLVQLLVARNAELRDDLDRRRDLLRGCLIKLQSWQRKVVEGYYYDRTSVEVISASSGRSVDAIYKTLQRARLALLDCIRAGLDAEGTS